MKGLFTLFIIASSLKAYTQIDGANVFGTDQVLTIDLTFTQTDFWDSLEYYYDSETYMTADLVITDNMGTHTYPSIGIRLKGNSSYGHPGNKKSFKIDFNEYVSGQNYDGLKKLNFNNCFKDPTFMREKIFFDVAREVGIPTPRVNYANVYMNGTLWGFYNVVEQIDDQFLDWAIMEDSGNLFKAGSNFQGNGEEADLKYYGTDQSTYYSRYELESNETQNDWTDFIALLDYINNSDDESFAYQFEMNFEKNELLKSMALDNLFSNLDSYLNSARNYYLYHNMVSNKWEWIKWDGNEAFGLYTGGPGAGNLTQLTPNYTAANRPLNSRVFDDVNLYRDYLVVLCELLESTFTNSNVDAKIDAVKALIATHVYNDPNKMYTDANFDQNTESDITVSGGGPGGNQTVYGLKSFVQQRSAYLTSQIDCSSVSVDEESIAETLSIYPNPFEDAFYIYNPDGGTVKITNELGEDVSFIIVQESEELYKVEINGSEGLYFVEVQSSKTRIIRPVVKQ